VNPLFAPSRRSRFGWRMHRGERRRRSPGRFPRPITARPAALGWVCAVLVVAGCTTVVDGRAVSMLYDPLRVGGLPVTGGPSGPREDAPPPTGKVDNTDGGAADKLALLAINDVEQFWQQTYNNFLKGTFTPIHRLISYDSNDPRSLSICDSDTYHLANAFYCRRDKVMAWDRGVLVPTAQRFFGDMSVDALVAHEYGHAIQQMAGLVNGKTPTIVAEQQADCFSGVYLRWVAEGHSPRFTVSTGDGLDHVLAGVITIREPVLTPQDAQLIDQGHGTAADRISALGKGFIHDAAACAAIDMDEIKQRRGDLPMSVQVNPAGEREAGELAINKDTISALMETLGKIFSPKQPPALSVDRANCADAQANPPASYCPATNTVVVDLPALQKMGAPANETNYVRLQGNVVLQGADTALSVVMSRYVLDLERERGLPLDTPAAAVLTACLTGVAHRKMAEPVQLALGNSLVMTAGNIDEAAAGLLTNGLVASDVNGARVPAGFTRMTAFAFGFLGTEELCYQRLREGSA
jgi:predicted metalloprotease